MMMITFKIDLPPFLPASMAISAMVVEKGEDGEEETWPIVTSQTRPGLACFLTVGLEQPAAAQRGQRWG